MEHPDSLEIDEIILQRAGILRYEELLWSIDFLKNAQRWMCLHATHPTGNLPGLKVKIYIKRFLLCIRIDRKGYDIMLRRHTEAFERSFQFNRFSSRRLFGNQDQHRSISISISILQKLSTGDLVWILFWDSKSPSSCDKRTRTLRIGTQPRMAY